MMPASPDPRAQPETPHSERAAPAQSSAPPIEMNRVTVASMSDQSTAVIEAVDWTVAAGDYWILAGLQGSGKSDFLITTAGLMPPLSGSYRFFGEEMPIFDEARLPQRLRLAMVFETGQLFNHLTVGENVALPLRFHRNLTKAQAEPEVQKYLEAMELGPWADSTPGALSVNWKKRVGLARALVLQPDVLILDSPLTGLDLRHIEWWLGFLDQLYKGHPLQENRQLTIIATTADLRPWRRRAHQFAILRNRSLSILGSRSQLESASDELVHELLPAERLAL